MTAEHRRKQRLLNPARGRPNRPFKSAALTTSTPVAVYVVHTTGLGATDRVVELGCARVNLPNAKGAPGRVGDVSACLVDPGRPIPAEATEVHGVTDAMVQGAVHFTQAWSRLVATAPYVACHNAAFAALHLPLPRDALICTLTCARVLMPGQGQFSLDALVQGLDLPRPDSAHTRAAIGQGAGLDAWNVGWLVERLARLAPLDQLVKITEDARRAGADMPDDASGPLPFGKHKGKTLTDPAVPVSYLAWIAGNYTGRDFPVWRAAANAEMTRRHADPCGPDVYQIARGPKPGANPS